MWLNLRKSELKQDEATTSDTTHSQIEKERMKETTLFNKNTERVNLRLCIVSCEWILI